LNARRFHVGADPTPALHNNQPTTSGIEHAYVKSWRYRILRTSRRNTIDP
jgi:hypothetical protein